MNKRIFAAILALAMALVLLPSTALAARVDAAGSYTMDFATSSGTWGRFTNYNFAGENAQDAGWSWNHTTKTLTLDDFHFTTTTSVALKFPAGATVIVLNDSSFTATNRNAGSGAIIADADSFGIYAAGDLTVTGSGTLSATGGSVAGTVTMPDTTTAPAKSCGVHAIGSIAVENGARLTGNGRAAEPYSYGICCGSLRVTGSGSHAVGAAVVPVDAGGVGVAIIALYGSRTINGSVLDPAGGVIGNWSGSGIPGTIRTVLAANGEPAAEATLGPAPEADVPKTGDSAMPLLWAGLILLAGAGLLVLRRKRRA